MFKDSTGQTFLPFACESAYYIRKWQVAYNQKILKYWSNTVNFKFIKLLVKMIEV